MKRILYVFSGEKAQGAEIVIERLMNYNAAAVNAHLFIAPGDFANQLKKNKKLYHVTTLNNLRRLFRSSSNKLGFYLKAVQNHFVVSYKVLRYIKKEKINVIHANNIMAASYLLPAVLFSKIFFRKKVWLWSDHDMAYQARLDSKLSNLCAKLYDSTLAVSQAVAKKYKDNNKVTVLYNGLDTNLFKPDNIERDKFRRVMNLPDNAIALGMAAKVIPGKGHALLVEVFELLCKRFPNIYLLLAGGFAEDHPLYAETIKQGIATNDKIIYLGFLNEMQAFYNGCDILISNSDTSMSESLGTSIYEAMAFEKILVASETGGTPEIINNYIDGFLFEPEQPEELLAKLDQVIINFPLFGYIKIAARETVEKKFNIHSMVQQYNQLVDNLARKKTG